MFTYKVVPVGDGSLYGWAKFNEKGERVEEGSNYYPSGADAEKFLRTIVSGVDKIEVAGINNVNTDSNSNVKLVVGEDALDDRYHGMEPVEVSVDEILPEKAKEEAAEKTSAKKAPARKASSKSKK